MGTDTVNDFKAKPQISTEQPLKPDKNPTSTPFICWYSNKSFPSRFIYCVDFRTYIYDGKQQR